MAAFPTPQYPFTLTPLANKGISVIATSSIPSNTLLFTESPLLLLSSSSSHCPTRILSTFHLQPSPQKRLLLSLCSNLPQTSSDEEVILGVWKTNNFCLDLEGTVNGVFEIASRLNHACVGGENCRWDWDGERGVLTFWTVKDVQDGEELTHCYRPDWRMGGRNRAQALWEEYGFWCGCRTCEEEEEED
ncbi:hypothetical protein BDD12DRAFT_878914 [Trichophaea hybrida]|nr:hypothetical protein BDD12DRAFT_878914 [Trichophaea hybrida]